MPQEFTSSSGRLQVSLLQPNVRQDEKFDRALMDANLDLLAQQIEAARGQLVITPESVVPLPLDYLSPDYLQRIRQAAAQRPLLLGIFIVTAVLVSLFNLVTDIAYSIADPRVELGR